MKKIFISCLFLVALAFIVISLSACTNDNAPEAPKATEGLRFTVNEDRVSYSVRDIGTAMGDEIVIPQNYNGYPVTKIYHNAFSGHIGLKSITIPSSVKEIGSAAFYGCTALVNVELPDSVEKISNDAFAGCSALKSISIGNSICSIAGDAFEGCTSLEYNLYDNAKYLGNSTNPCVVLIEAASSAISTCSIPNTTRIIFDFAFQNCKLLSYVTIPDNVAEIGNRAFLNCTNLERVVIGESVRDIGDSAFYSCTSLEVIILPDSVVNIGDNAFSNCRALREITLGNRLECIGTFAFSSCSALVKIKYSGTKAEWEMIEKGYYWDYGSTKYSMQYNYVP